MRKQATGSILVLILSCAVSTLAWQGAPHPSSDDAGTGTAWSELGRGMEKMHSGMTSIKPSGDNDVDFVRLMLPHHQAAIDMAKIELEYGKDAQMRRLAQEIITDQQSESELMQLWLKDHGLKKHGLEEHGLKDHEASAPK